LWHAALDYYFSQSNDFQKAEDALVHASTYHWLARHKHNDSRDLLTSRKYQADDDGAMHKFDKNYYKKEGKLIYIYMLDKTDNYSYYYTYSNNSY